MEVIDGLERLPRHEPSVVTVGVFDGVHRGHVRVLRTLASLAREERAAAVVITFEPHPEAVLRGVQPALLCDPAERLALLGVAGAARVVVHPFTAAFSRLEANAFLELCGAGEGMRAIVMSPESAFGRDRTGTRATVAELGARLGFRVVDQPHVEVAGERVSSSAIRAAVESGRLGHAARLLGRRYAVIGRVVPGDRRGRELGYPTANLAYDAPVTLPPNGVYAVRVSWGGPDPLRPARRVDGVASLGVRPTFGGGERLLEVHLFDLDEDLYGERLRVEFVRRQRGERRFADATALVAQMDRDAVRARAILAGSPRTAGAERTSAAGGAPPGAPA